MKTVISLTFAFTLFLSVSAQDNGILFKDLGWEQAMADARQSDKLIFVDCYTTWCGPCKMMDKNVFSDPAVGDYFNAHFVNIKLDMEKGEGAEFAKSYGVTGYPTLMFLNGEGKMVHKAVGYRQTDDFVEIGHAANDPARQMGALESRYQDGKMDESSMINYALALKTANDRRASKIAAEYLDGQDDWNTPENMSFIIKVAPFDMESRIFKHISANRAAFNEAMPEAQVDEYLKGVINYSLRKKATDQSPEELIGTVFGSDADQFVKEYTVRKHLYAKDEAGIQSFLAAVDQYVADYTFTSWSMNNSVAWRIYEVSDDPVMLEVAKKLAESSIEMESNYYNNDTLAAICFKLKEKEKALMYAEKAIELAKENGMDHKETDDLIKRIQAL